MLKIERYPDLEEALDENMTKDIDHVLIRHSYRQGGTYSPTSIPTTTST